jgi:hypothetical protein
MSTENVIHGKLFDHTDIFRRWNEISVGRDDSETGKSGVIDSDGTTSSMWVISGHSYGFSNGDMNRVDQGQWCRSQPSREGRSILWRARNDTAACGAYF